MSWTDRIFRRKKLRRAGIIGQPFPDAWLRSLRETAPFYARLPADHQRVLRQCMQVFIAEKEFLGIGELKITDGIKIAIAAPACLLLVGIPHVDVYPRLREVIVYPHDFGTAVEAVGPDGRRYRIPNLRAGEAWRRGPVVLAWNSVKRSIVAPCDGFNVVFHEFAHVLDMHTHIASSAPPLKSRQQRTDWVRVFDTEYQAFTDANRQGRRTFIDPYGASSPAEFFAVVTEHFFEQPRQLGARHPALYTQFKALYRQDPANWTANPAQ